MRPLLLLLLSLIPLLADVHEEALIAANEAGKIFESEPAKASILAEKAYQLLASDPASTPPDLAACAGLSRDRTR